MRARILLTTSLLLLSSLLGSTQDAAPTPDFSDGFKQLAALGFPALDANAKWVTARDVSIAYELRNAAKSLKGSGWLLPAVEGKAQVLALGDVAPIESKPTSASPDLAKDVAIIIAAINKDAKNIDQDASDSLLNNRYSSSTIAADLLLFATQLYQTGHPELANQLAFALFSAVPSRETVVDAAIDKFAGTLYTKATVAFFDSGDWAAYEKSLTELTQRFPRGWSSRDAIALFLPQVTKQAAGEKPPAPTLPDTVIDPRALAILSELAEPPTPAARAAAEKANQDRRKLYLRNYDEYGDSDSNVRPLWLLDSPTDPKPNAPAMERLMALKMAALPALAALLGDPFLTHSANGSSYSSTTYYSSNESPEEVLLKKYQSLHRPSTRGEIAKQLLLATLPDSDDSSSSPDDETLRQQVLEFWNAHKDASREQLAAIFLSEGSRNQVAQASRLLATATDPQSHQIFEAHVLGLDPALGAFEQVQIYLRARKTAGKPFFDAYAKLVRSQTPADAHLDENASDETSWLLKQSGGVEKMLKSLGSMVSPVPPRTLAVQIAKGKPADAKEAINGLEPLMSDLSPTKQLHAYLEGANAATDASIRARFLSATLEIDWEDEEEVEEPAEPADDAEDAPPPVRLVSEPEAKVWRKLLADQRDLPKDIGITQNLVYLSRNAPLGLTKITDLAAIAFEFSASSNRMYGLFADAPILGKPALDIIKETVTARLAGQPVPEHPDSDKVTEERLAAIVAEAGAKPPAEIHPYLKTLTPDERAAWREWLNEPGDLALPDAVKTLRATITSKFPGDDRVRPPAKYTSSIEPGFQITPDNLLKYIESIAPKIAEFSPYLITTSDADFGPGQQVAEIILSLADAPATPPAKEADESSADSETSDDKESPRQNPLSSWQRLLKDLRAALEETPAATAAINILVPSRREGERSNLTILLGSDGKLTVLRKPDAEAPAETPQEALKKVILADEPAPIYLRILTRAHADILFKDAADEDSNILPPP